MKLRLSPRAEADLDSIAAYLAARDPQALQHVQDQLAAALRLLLDHPQAGRHVGRGLRRLSVPRLPYLIVYRVDEAAEAVAVATIRHTARRLDPAGIRWLMLPRGTDPHP
ncbi:MAG: type II toxin-antitoxin system RelE/ParE family toxin [Methylobacterium sp.]|uniref:type II toxin-antitoxin system RelE/ParE family toxin n=1 Tax=Methylobacterium sp. TaxID=409 RepID=UPI0025D35433|nr:type II toxin-antitoxin system RelE/ParE family toxin [Methylobacterium sp.]MBX9931811.1 type II toxin-antitoxin system RelE/ParE family toxin [Methylobacterium sp.]